MNNNVITFLKSKECVDFFKKYWIKKVDLFWSYARWEETKNSDLDLLVSCNEICRFKDFLIIEDFLIKKLNIKFVDIWEHISINKIIWPYIEKDLLTIF